MSNNDKIKKRISALVNKLNKWSDAYYNDGETLIDDKTFDLHLKDLKELEEKYPELIMENSPTINVGFASKEENFKKVDHKVQMLSLKNAFNEGDLFHFDKQLKQIYSDYEYFVEPKVDGLSISIEYKNGKLFRAVTRGDGLTGEIVTKNVEQISDIPKEISLKKNIEVRGEIYLSLSEFKKINDLRKAEGKILYSNPRNFASGTLRQLDHNIVKERNLKAFIYWAYNLEEKKYVWNTQSDTIDNLKKLNFKITEISSLEKDIDGVLNKINSISGKRKKLDYEIDGIVIKVNDLLMYDEIGETSKFPKWAIAYKLPSKTTRTKLLEIFPTVGRTGRITYNAKLEPVEIDGTIVQRATLHNASYIKDLDLRVGDIVEIKKAGEIIPKVISYIKEERKGPLNKWVEHKDCPSCGEKSKLIRYEGEVDQYCINEACKARLIESIIHFSSRYAMNIEGFSSKQIEKFIELGFLKSIKDIYLLKNRKEEILNLNGYQEKSVNSLLNSIEKSKDNSLDKFLFGLGIRYIGKKTALDVANNFKDLKTITSSDVEDFLNQEDLGEVKSKSIIQFFKDEKNLDLLKALYELGVRPHKKETKKLNISKKINGKKVVVTGTIKNSTRNEVKELLENKGAIVLTSISSRVDFIIVGAKPSQNKLNKINSDKIINISNLEELKKI